MAGVKHVLFALALVLYILVGGMIIHQYAAAVMTAAWVRHWRAHHHERGAQRGLT